MKKLVKTTVMLLLFLGIVLTTNAQIEKGKSLIDTWYVTGYSIEFNSDGTGLLKIVDLNKICSDTNVPFEWSVTTPGTVTLKNGEYTYCSGHSEYETSVSRCLMA